MVPPLNLIYNTKLKLLRGHFQFSREEHQQKKVIEEKVSWPDDHNFDQSLGMLNRSQNNLSHLPPFSSSLVGSTT